MYGCLLKKIKWYHHVNKLFFCLSFLSSLCCCNLWCVTLCMRNSPVLFDGAWTWLLLSTWSFDSWFFRAAHKYINTYVIFVLCDRGVCLCEQDHTRCSYESCFTVIRYEGLCGATIIFGLGSLATDLMWTNDTFTSENNRHSMPTLSDTNICTLVVQNTSLMWNIVFMVINYKDNNKIIHLVKIYSIFFIIIN